MKIITLWVILPAALAACSGGGKSDNFGTSGGSDSAAGDADAVWVTTGGAVGVAGAGSTGSKPPVSVPYVEIAETWGMVGFEDPVAVVLSRDGTSLTGFGCYAGLPQPYPTFDERTCGQIVDGQVEGQHVQFAIAFGNSGLARGVVYAADVVVSEDGKRMAGRFGVGHDGTPISWSYYPTAWLPIESPLSNQDTTWISYGSSRDPFPGSSGSSSYELKLREESSNGDEFTSERTYSLLALDSGVVIAGDFGAFWIDEWTRSADGRRMTVGPVPPTAPGLPVSMMLHFDSGALTLVDATTASGSYMFDVNTRAQ